MAALLKTKDAYSDSQRVNNHSRYYYLKTVLVLCYVVPLGHPAALPITQYIHLRAAKSNAISNKSQPKRQVKQISLQCSIYINSGIRDVIQNTKTRITYL